MTQGQGEVQIKSQVLILNGSGGVGKDTFVDLVGEYINTFHYSSVSKIKEIATTMGWDGGKTEKDRKFISDLKLLSTEYNDMPFEEVTCAVNKFLRCYENDSLLFVDIREPEEIEKAVQQFGALTILISNENVEKIESNIGDKNVFEYEYDYYIPNNGTVNELRDQAEMFVALYRANKLRKIKSSEIREKSQRYCFVQDNEPNWYCSTIGWRQWSPAGNTTAQDTTNTGLIRI
jgi:hypothetical protein